MKALSPFLLVGALLFSVQGQAACPTLSSANIGYYLCPAIGSSNVLPQGFTAMVYSRPAKWSLGDICANGRDAAAKYFGKQKEYDGVETDITNGSIKCLYELPAEWKEKAGVDEFSMEARVDNPASLRGTACLPLSFRLMAEMMQHANYRVDNGPEWTITAKNKGIKKVLEGLGSLFKGAVASLKDAPLGVLPGRIKESEFKAFAHTCTYSYHSGVGDKAEERQLVLRGSLSLPMLKAVNDVAAGDIKKLNDENKK